MLRTRKIVKITNPDATNLGQYEGIYGQGKSNFIYGADALAQILTHQILTIRGELSNRIDFGVDWFKKGQASQIKSMYDAQIKQILIDNIYVNSILTFTSEFTNTTNTYTASFSVDTTEGILQLSI